MSSSKDGEEAETSTSLSDVAKMPPRMSSVDDSVMLPEDYQPKDEDVVCSWARQNHSHPGNEQFRKLIDKYAPIYQKVDTKYQKSEVIAKIVAEVRKNGHFCKKDFYSGRWFEIGDEKARDKVGHAIRKAAADLNKKQGTTSSKKLSRSTQQKRKIAKKQVGQFGNLSSANPTFSAPLTSIDSSQNRSSFGNIGIGMGDVRADRATASFLTPTLDPSWLSQTSQFAATNVATLPSSTQSRDLENLRSLYGNPAISSTSLSGAASAGLDTTTTNDSDAFFHTLQRRRLLMNEAQRQQAANLIRQSNEMTLLAQNELELQRRRAAVAFGGVGFGVTSLSNSGLGLSSFGRLLPSAASTGSILSENMLLQQALQQRATAESLLTQSIVSRTNVDGDGSGNKSHGDQEPTSGGLKGRRGSP